MADAPKPREHERQRAPWPPPNRDYFTIRVVDPHVARNVSQVLYWEQERGNLYVGPSVRLTGPGGCVQLDSHELAERFSAYAIPVLRKRHGDDIELDVVVGSAPTKISVSWTAEQSQRVREMLDAKG